MSKLNEALRFPAARRDPTSGYTAHGHWFADPYAWLEHLDDPEVQTWIAAQEAVTRGVLDVVPGRERLREMLARSTRYVRRSAPLRTGPDGREFVWQASATDDKHKLLLRRMPTRRWRQCSTPTPGPARRRWCSPHHRPTAS